MSKVPCTGGRASGLGFAIGSDPLLAAAVWTGGGALTLSAGLLVMILLLRLRLIARLARERRFAERWRPVFAACAVGVPEYVPPLAPEDGPLFLALWLRAQESLRAARTSKSGSALPASMRSIVCAAARDTTAGACAASASASGQTPAKRR